MTTFFVPLADSPEKAEEVRGVVVQGLQEGGFPVTDRRIHKISYLHDGRHYDAEVGKLEARSDPGGGMKRPGGAVVMLIFEVKDHRVFLVCTPTRGIFEGPPIIVGEHAVNSISHFD